MNPFLVVIPFVVVAIGGALLAHSWSSAQEAALTISPEHEQRLIELDHEAIEAAYRQHVTALFLTWMKDDRGQPERAQRGAQQAKRAYVRSMDSIEQRKGSGLTLPPK